MGPHPSLLRGRNIGQDFTVKDGFRMYHGDTGISGFPQHPHRGFETITIVTEGVVDHHDSMSAKARFGGGGSDTQWVTTGSGIQHSEMFPLVKREENNPLELFQIWLNLPAKNKMCKPYFTMLWSEKNPVVVSEDKKSKVTVICDQSKIVVKESRQVTPPPDSWASQEGSDVAVMLIDVEAGSTYTLPAAKFRETKRTIYMFEGSSVKVNGTTIQKLESASLSPLDEVEINNEFGENCRFLLLQGKPINEPVVQRGSSFIFFLHFYCFLFCCLYDSSLSFSSSRFHVLDVLFSSFFLFRSPFLLLPLCSFF